MNTPLALLLQEAVKAGAGHPSRWRMFLNTLITWGPGGLFLLAILDSAGIPIVGGVDLLLVNVSAARPQAAAVAAICAVIGSLIGSAVLFGIARKGGELFLEKYINSGRGARIHRWFGRYGLITVFIPALSPLPMPMKIAVFCAGALEVSWFKFLSVILAARVIRYAGLAYFGAIYGARTLLYLRAHILTVTSIALGLAAAAIIVLQIQERRQRRAAKVVYDPLLR